MRRAATVQLIHVFWLVRVHCRVHLSLPPVYFIQYLDISYHLHKLLNSEWEVVDDYNGKCERCTINVLSWREWRKLRRFSVWSVEFWFEDSNYILPQVEGEIIPMRSIISYLPKVRWGKVITDFWQWYYTQYAYKIVKVYTKYMYIRDLLVPCFMLVFFFVLGLLFNP
jgi:hypothetical protein